MIGFCRDCLDGGVRVATARKLPGGTEVCDLHFRRRMRMPEQTTTIQEDTMPKDKEVDWSAVQRDRDAGVKVSELVKKYGVSNPTIYTRTHSSKNSQKHAAKNGATRIAESGNGAMSTPNLIFALKTKRDALSAAIAALESSEG